MREKEKLIRNCIVAGITSKKAYQQCISKGSSLTLSGVYHNLPNGRCNTVGKYKPLDQRYSPNQSYKTAQHQYTGSTTFITHEEDTISEGGAATEAADIVQAPKQTSTTQVTHVSNCGNPQHKYRSECKAFKVECYLCHRLGHFAHMCRTYLNAGQKNKVKYIDMNEEEKLQSEHCKQNYTTPLFLKKEDGTQTTVKSLKTAKVHYIHNKDTEHI